ncbi:MAG: SsrA-binding protein SmpB [Lentisphaeria bacterium]|nr:SsrA-binding protein SmpB [Lentisphaeria bacterium]
MPRATPKDPVLASNKKAFHDYTVLDKYEAGIQLSGTEVKSCRDRAVQMGEGYIKVENCQAFLYNMHISVYGFGNRFNHEVKRPRRLLLHKREIMKLAQMVNTKGGTIVPLKMYLKNGLIKVEIAYCQGKTHADIRETLRKREADMDMRRNLGKRG